MLLVLSISSDSVHYLYQILSKYLIGFQSYRPEQKGWRLGGRKCWWTDGSMDGQTVGKLDRFMPEAGAAKIQDLLYRWTSESFFQRNSRMDDHKVFHFIQNARNPSKTVCMVLFFFFFSRQLSLLWTHVNRIHVHMDTVLQWMQAHRMVLLLILTVLIAASIHVKSTTTFTAAQRSATIWSTFNFKYQRRDKCKNMKPEKK